MGYNYTLLRSDQICFWMAQTIERGSSDLSEHVEGAPALHPQSGGSPGNTSAVQETESTPTFSVGDLCLLDGFKWCFGQGWMDVISDL